MPRTTLGLPHLPDTQLELAAWLRQDGGPNDPAAAMLDGGDISIGCLCTVCHEPLKIGQWVRQQALYKLGELDSILIGHATCCPEADNAPADPKDVPVSVIDVAAGDRLRWPGSGPGWHVALGPAVPDEREGPLAHKIRVRAPSGQHLDAVIPADVQIESDQRRRGDTAEDMARLLDNVRRFSKLGPKDWRRFKSNVDMRIDGDRLLVRTDAGSFSAPLAALGAL